MVDLYRKYMDWLQSNGCIFPSLSYPKTFWDEEVIGVKARVSIPPSKAFLFIPYSITINVPQIKSSEIGPLFDSYPYWYAGHAGAADNMIWTFLIYESLKGELSFWHPYFQILPEMSILLDWSSEELNELQDPFLEYDVERWVHRRENSWSSLEEVFSENPQIFPPGVPLKPLFMWAWKLTTTRSFAWEGGMIIPFADNVNHSNVNVKYLSFHRDEILQKIKNNDKIDYSDFLGKRNKTEVSDPTYSNLNRVEKYLVSGNEVSRLESARAIWEVEHLIIDFKSDSDNETVRYFGDVPSEDEIEDEDEEFKTLEQMQGHYFMLVTTQQTAYTRGSQVFNSYGSLSNRELLLDYGFTLDDNKYDAFYIRMWKHNHGRFGMMSAEDVRSVRHDQIEDVSELITLKAKKFNSNIFTYFRKNLNLVEVEELKHIKSPLVLGTPLNTHVEKFICDKVLELYNGIVQMFPTTIQHDSMLMTQACSPKLRHALVYRISQKSILQKQIEYVNTLKSVLDKSIFHHLTENSLQEVMQVYPLSKYLRCLRCNLLLKIDEEPASNEVS